MNIHKTVFGFSVHFDFLISFFYLCISDLHHTFIISKIPFIGYPKIELWISVNRIWISRIFENRTMDIKKSNMGIHK